MRWPAVAGLVVLAAGSAEAQTLLVPEGASWKYLDNGSNQGTAWRAPGFDDSTWPSGPAQLGYGDGDEATVVSFGPNPANKYVTTYFRHEFTVADPSVFVGQTLQILRDDGAVVYLNGVEVVRENMPATAIASSTLATQVIDGSTEDVFEPHVLDASLLVPGANVLAVELHQANVASSDVSFDLELAGNTGIGVIRGPYLQMGTPASVVVRWRTDAFTDGRVLVGPDPGALTASFTDGTIAADHEIEVVGLAPESTYYYAVGTSTSVLAGNDPEHYFVTPPPIGAARPVRAWVLGDSGTATSNAAAVRDAYDTFTGAQHTGLWFMLGDNAYSNGTDGEYQAAVFEMYPDMLRRSVLWPTRGNHEMFAGNYYDIFTLPDGAQAGGIASGTEAYHSFDWANVHWICLDSYGSSRAVGGPMHTWVQADLASTLQDWIIAYWHHPPYSKGSHDSDVEQELIEMRENFLPVLEAGGVDLVLSGHSHSYERSFLLDGHYGTSGTLTPQMLVDEGDGRPEGDGAYNRAAGPHQGAVYTVAGSSGQTSPGPLNHPAMFMGVQVLGSVVIDVDGGRLDLTFLDDGGQVIDWFTMLGPSYTGTYCVPKVSSSGCEPSMGLSGTPSVALALPFLATASAVETGKSGLLFYGYGPLNAPFQGGMKCVKAPTVRTALQGSGGAGICGGAYSYDFNARIQSGVDPGLVAGVTVYCQYWYRDPQSASMTGLSDAAQFVIQP